MILDAYLYTQNATLLEEYLPIVTLTIDFFRQHYHNCTTDGKMVVWPTQVLETYWCGPTANGTYWDTSVTPSCPPSNCCVDDMPTVAALHSLLERVLQLPERFTTAVQRVQWVAFSAILPKIPLTADGRCLAAAGNVSEGIHNSETPELYSVHPFRVYTKARSITRGVDSSHAMSCLHKDAGCGPTCGNARGNSGWNQGVMDAALLGDSEMAWRFVAQRAAQKPAVGYRFIGFAAHYQDSQPSADHFANMNSALNWMLVQPGDDGYTNSTVVLLPAWPCQFSVKFKLAAPGATVVEVDYEGAATGNGALASLVVTPEGRKSNVVFANCVGV